MDTNLYALEFLARDRLERAWAAAARERLVPRAARPPGAGVRLALGLALVTLGRWVRRAASCTGDVGDRLEPRVA